MSPKVIRESWVEVRCPEAPVSFVHEGADVLPPRRRSGNLRRLGVCVCVTPGVVEHCLGVREACCLGLTVNGQDCQGRVHGLECAQKCPRESSVVSVSSASPYRCTMRHDGRTGLREMCWWVKFAASASGANLLMVHQVAVSIAACGAIRVLHVSFVNFQACR